MDANRNKVREMSIARTMERLRKNNMEAAFLPSAQDVVPMLRSMLEVRNWGISPGTGA